MKKFDKNKIEEGEQILERIRERIIVDPKDSNVQYSNIDSPKWFIEFGKIHGIFKVKDGYQPNNYKVYLTSKGRDMFNNGGFKHLYRYEVLFPREIKRYNYHIHRYWWISIIISILSIFISIFK